MPRRRGNTVSIAMPAHLKRYRCTEWIEDGEPVPGQIGHWSACYVGWSNWCDAVGRWADENGLDPDSSLLDFRYDDAGPCTDT